MTEEGKMHMDEASRREIDCYGFTAGNISDLLVVACMRNKLNINALLEGVLINLILQEECTRDILVQVVDSASLTAKTLQEHESKKPEPKIVLPN